MNAIEDQEMRQLSKQFIERVKSLMLLHQISNAELARRLDVSIPYLCKVLRGESNLTILSMLRFAKAVGCQIEIGLNKL